MRDDDFRDMRYCENSRLSLDSDQWETSNLTFMNCINQSLAWNCQERNTEGERIDMETVAVLHTAAVKMSKTLWQDWGEKPIHCLKFLLLPQDMLTNEGISNLGRLQSKISGRQTEAVLYSKAVAIQQQQNLKRPNIIVNQPAFGSIWLFLTYKEQT